MPLLAPLLSLVALAGTAPPSGAAGAAPSLVDPTDIAALVLMALFSIHRIEIRGTDPRAFPGVAPADFEAWHRAAMRGKSLAINACFLKFALNNGWYYATRRVLPMRVVAAGGVLVFFAWLVALAVGALLSARARRRAAALGIVVGRKIVEGAAVTDAPREREASSR